jgi:hypothetical protein
MALSWPFQLGIGVLLGMLLNSFWTKSIYGRWPRRMVIRGRHVHHSAFGLVLILLGLWQLLADHDTGAFLMLAGMGAGIIIGHTRKERGGWRPVFIEKD